MEHNPDFVDQCWAYWDGQQQQVCCCLLTFFFLLLDSECRQKTVTAREGISCDFDLDSDFDFDFGDFVFLARQACCSCTMACLNKHAHVGNGYACVSFWLGSKTRGDFLCVLQPDLAVMQRCGLTGTAEHLFNLQEWPGT